MPVQVRPSAPASARFASFGSASCCGYQSRLWCDALFFAILRPWPTDPANPAKRLWRMLLPGTPFPACGVPHEPSDPAGDGVGPDAKDDNAERNGERGAVVR